MWNRWYFKQRAIKKGIVLLFTHLSRFNLLNVVIIEFVRFSYHSFDLTSFSNHSSTFLRLTREKRNVTSPHVVLQIIQADNIDLSDKSLQVDISDALSEKDKVKFTVHTKTTLPEFQKPDFLVVRQHEEFVWLHDRFEENEEYAGYIVRPITLSIFHILHCFYRNTEFCSVWVWKMHFLPR